MSLLGVLTTAFLVAVIAVECLDVGRPWRPIAWVGLAASGLPWLGFYAAGITGLGILALLFPLLAVILGAGYLIRAWSRRRKEDLDLAQSGGWRCPSCGTANAAVNAVCYRCQTSRL